MKLFDAHNHVHDPRLAGDLEGVMQRAADAGVDRMVCCGTTRDDWQAVLEVASRFPDSVVPSLGLHPCYVACNVATQVNELHGLLSRFPAAVGEVGLDHAIEERSDSVQEEAFLLQVALSRELEVPVSIHCRRAWGRMMDFLRRMAPHPAGLLLHAYSGSAELAEELVEKNAYFSFGAGVTYPHNRRIRAAAQAVPTERLLVETDAPDMLPYPCREDGEARPNEPANIVHAVRALAEIRSLSMEEMAVLTWENGEQLFARLLDRGPPA
jgi:TatD DNase family protein